MFPPIRTTMFLNAGIMMGIFVKMFRFKVVANLTDFFANS